jgi:hypothetical protein
VSEHDEHESSDEGGDPACWVQLVCPACGAIIEPEHHCVKDEGASVVAEH